MTFLRLIFGLGLLLKLKFIVFLKTLTLVVMIVRPYRKFVFK